MSALTTELSARKREVLFAAVCWWQMRRPSGWSVQQHYENPAINTCSPSEGRLAIAVAALLQSTGGSSGGDEG